MDEDLDFGRLLQFWFDENYTKYKMLSLLIWEDQVIPLPTNYSHMLLKCFPCKSGKRLFYDSKVIVVDSKTYYYADPSFTFEDVIGIPLNQHLYHHRRGPLFETGWVPEKGVGVW